MWAALEAPAGTLGKADGGLDKHGSGGGGFWTSLKIKQTVVSDM